MIDLLLLHRFRQPMTTGYMQSSTTWIYQGAATAQPLARPMFHPSTSGRSEDPISILPTAAAPPPNPLTAQQKKEKNYQRAQNRKKAKQKARAAAGDSSGPVEQIHEGLGDKVDSGNGPISPSPDILVRESRERGPVVEDLGLPEYAEPLGVEHEVAQPEVAPREAEQSGKANKVDDDESSKQDHPSELDEHNELDKMSACSDASTQTCRSDPLEFGRVEARLRRLTRLPSEAPTGLPSFSNIPESTSPSRKRKEPETSEQTRCIEAFADQHHLNSQLEQTLKDFDFRCVTEIAGFTLGEFRMDRSAP